MKPMIVLTGLFLSLSLNAQIHFKDKTDFAGLGGSLLNNGLSLGDYDNDGREDIYVCALNGGPNRLYRNQGHFIFQEVAAQAGVRYSGTSKVSAWADIDNDGDEDLYVGNRDEAGLLYINQGNGTFTEESEARGLVNSFAASSVLFSDINRDGWLDVYIGNVLNPNALFLNTGDGHFENHTVASGATDQAVAMGSVFFDYDLDGDDDLYLTHDAQVPYILYENMGDATFQNISGDAQVNYAGFGMGVDVADYNLDGYMDMYITNLYDNVLYKNNGDGTFENVAPLYGVNNYGMGWGTVWADFDNDRYPDIYLSNDSYFSPYPNALYRNLGGNGFEEVSEGDPCESPFGGYAAVSSDLDDDGRMDLLVANSGAPGVQLFENTSDTNHYVSFRLEGVESNRDAIGAKLEVHTALGVQYDQVIGNSGWAGNNGRWIHFGLADQTHVDKVVIRWPSGDVEEISDLQADQKYRVREGEGVVTATKPFAEKTADCKVISSSSHQLTLAADEEVRDIAIVDMTGRRMPVIWTRNDNEVEIEFSSLASGLYQVVVRAEYTSCVIPKAVVKM